jgi:gas vesicle protein
MHSSDSYNDSNTGSGNEFFIGLLCGCAVGAAIGLLMAPKTGVEMRQTLAESAERFRRKASDTYSDASEKVSDASRPRNRRVGGRISRLEPPLRDDRQHDHVLSGCVHGGRDTGCRPSHQPEEERLL